ncbi:MAG: porin family protein [Desulfobacterales bacterium]|nr:porin family protein [Desulfobacterales bacterium]
MVKTRCVSLGLLLGAVALLMGASAGRADFQGNILISQMILSASASPAAPAAPADIKAMGPEQLAGLDSQLAEALQLYYEEKFDRALPLFEAIAQKVQTMDLMFWMGTSAAKTGRFELAEEKYKQMLAIDGNLHRVRLELADVYAATGRLDAARDELERVLAANPPESVRRKIEQRLALIGEKAKKTRFNLMASVGYQQDDNISSGPDTDQIVLSSGTLVLNSRQRQLDGYAVLGKLRGSVQHDLGAPGGLSVFGRLNFYHAYLPSETDFNFTSTDVSAGPAWVGRSAIATLPAGYTDARYGNEFLSGTLHVDPQVEYFFSKAVSARGAYTFARERYNTDTYPLYHNDLHRFSAGPIFYLDQRRHIIFPEVSYEARSAEVDYASYSAYSLSVGYLARLPFDLELFLRYQYTDRQYDGKPPLFSADREDERHVVNAILSRKFLKHFFVSLEYTRIDNNSNLALYDFEKNIFAVNTGTAF